jgi:hypothetical protein
LCRSATGSEAPVVKMVMARYFNHPMIEERRELLIMNCSTAKAPQVFL